MSRESRVKSKNKHKRKLSLKPNVYNKLQRNKLLIQFAEYMIGGGVYFWSGLGVFTLCYSVFHWHWLICKGLADIIGWTLNYMIQRYWAFYDKRLDKLEGRTRLRYILINTIDLFFDYGIVAVFKHFGIFIYFGFLASATFTTVWDYLWYKFWVFKPSD